MKNRYVIKNRAATVMTSADIDNSGGYTTDELLVVAECIPNLRHGQAIISVKDKSKIIMDSVYTNR